MLLHIPILEHSTGAENLIFNQIRSKPVSIKIVVWNSCRLVWNFGKNQAPGGKGSPSILCWDYLHTLSLWTFLKWTETAWLFTCIASTCTSLPLHANNYQILITTILLLNCNKVPQILPYKSN